VHRLKVGITVVAGQEADAALWSSGITQNIVYLAMLLQRLPRVEMVAMVSCGGAGDAPHALAGLMGAPTLSVAQAVETLDVIIELGARPEVEPMKRFRARGGKMVSYMAGNSMAMNFEELANDVRYGDYINDTGFDAVWITPQHWRMNHAYSEITRSPNTQMAPHIWHPMCLTQSAFRLRATPFWRPPAEPWRIGVFDPNVNVLKTFHLPLLVTDNAYRRRPGLIDRVLLFSAEHLKGNTHFEQFCAATDISQAGKVFAEGRFPVTQMMGSHIDAVVTHQWENELNYLYWDILYLGWPLIHNSQAFQDTGYYYPAFDPQTGGEVLVEALETHEREWAARRPGVLDTLWRFNIDNPAVQARHDELLEDLMA
jgi:hypothetical protein